jgi:outer membrane biosynthesis protein TonB
MWIRFPEGVSSISFEGLEHRGSVQDEDGFWYLDVSDAIAQRLHASTGTAGLVLAEPPPPAMKTEQEPPVVEAPTTEPLPTEQPPPTPPPTEPEPAPTEEHP